ncbi:MAG: hypothetical protein K9N51_04585 [Candidatus Pacebacteria bacterium]|nr:hypothetical protein [Candidatus Paceibacterota bacterium]
MLKVNAIATLFVLGASLAVAQENLIVNGCFADGTSDHWRLFPGYSEIVKLDEAVGECEYALHIRSDREAADKVRVFYNHKIMREPGCIYELSFRYRSPERPPLVRVRFEQTAFLRPFPASSDWREYTMEMISSPGRTNGVFEFYNRAGAAAEAWITDIRLRIVGDADLRPGTEWAQKLKTQMDAQGWCLTETEEHYIFARGLLSEYYRKSDKLFTFDEWLRACYMGRETQRLRYHFDRLPMGCYLYSNTVAAEAKRRGEPYEDTLDDIFRQMREKNVNTVLIGNIGSTDRLVLDVAAKHDIKVINQSSHLYFRPRSTPEETRNQFPPLLARLRERLDAGMDDHPALLAWSFKEEAYLHHVSWLSDLYRKIHRTGVKKPIYMLNNKLGVAQYPFAPAPDIYAVDLYAFKWIAANAALRSPDKGLRWAFGHLNRFYQASLPAGNPLIFVGLGMGSSSEYDGDRVNARETFGWQRNPETGKWRGCYYYYPPKHCMRTQMWVGIAAGAKGFLAWYYSQPAAPDAEQSFTPGLGCDRNGNEPPQFQEFADTAADLQSLAPYILNMNRRIVNRAHTGDEQVLVTTHHMEGGEETILAVVNLHTGTSPNGIRFDNETGQLTKYEPASARDIAITLDQPGPVFDLKSRRALTTDNHTFNVHLGPGDGTLLLLDTETAATRLWSRLGIVE